MQEAFEKLLSVFGGIKEDSGDVIIHFAHVKFVRNAIGDIICKDKDYWDLNEARIICNPRYYVALRIVYMSIRLYLIDIFKGYCSVHPQAITLIHFIF